jgi:hypothetical protein
MNKKKSHLRAIETPSTADKAVGAQHNEYDDLELLEHLESLQEEMEELGVSTLAEIIARIAELNQRLDDE